MKVMKRTYSELKGLVNTKAQENYRTKILLMRRLKNRDMSKIKAFSKHIQNPKIREKTRDAIFNQSSKSHQLYKAGNKQGISRNSHKGHIIKSLVRHGVYINYANVHGNNTILIHQLTNKGIPIKHIKIKFTNKDISKISNSKNKFKKTKKSGQVLDGYILGTDDELHLHKQARTKLTEEYRQEIWDKCPRNKSGRRYCPRCGKLFEPSDTQDTIKPPKNFEVDHGVSVKILNKANLSDTDLGKHNLFPICSDCNKYKAQRSNTLFNKNKSYHNLIDKSIKIMRQRGNEIRQNGVCLKDGYKSIVPSALRHDWSVDPSPDVATTKWSEPYTSSAKYKAIAEMRKREINQLKQQQKKQEMHQKEKMQQMKKKIKIKNKVLKKLKQQLQSNHIKPQNKHYKEHTKRSLKTKKSHLKVKKYYTNQKTLSQIKKQGGLHL